MVLFHDAVSQKLPAGEIWEISAFYHALIVLELGQRIGPTSRAAKTGGDGRNDSCQFWIFIVM
jgi:hypothetical protein